MERSKFSNHLNSKQNEQEDQVVEEPKAGFAKQFGGLLLDQGDLNQYDPITVSCEIDKHGIKIDAKEVFMCIDDEGVTDYTTGERNQMILPNDVEYIEEIGAGNGGVVKLAKHKQTGAPFAIKIINVYDKGKRHQLYNELSTLKSVDNPFLLKCFGAHFKEGSVRLVLEYMDCGSLETMIKVLNMLATPDNHILMPELVISRIIFQILNAIQYLHDDKQQIHRDLKPDNILVSSELGLAKLSDFGISKQLELKPVNQQQQPQMYPNQFYAQNHSPMSDSSGLYGNPYQQIPNQQYQTYSTATYVGTLCYMSPERLDSSQYSFPSDIWGLGIIIYEMVTGKNPYPPTDKPIILYEQMMQEPAPDLDKVPGVSESLKDFIKGMLQKDPNMRQTASQLLNHHFILSYNSHGCDDEDHIYWFKQYLAEKEKLAQKNRQQKVDLKEHGLDGLVGLA